MINSTRQSGNLSEDIAVSYIEKLGYKVIERNYYARKLGEIDIIATYNGVWHFIEVKSAQADFDPIYNFSATKLKRVINSTYYYLKEKGLDVDFCIDVIVIRGREIEFLENVTI
ncbi:MAG TPA: YraN family protein [Campylobacterales bacterium]|nr:YraN family protein [Arcobacter sp.]HHD80652.1 YraN family protein [Campylobacterales bacterium]